MAHDSRRVVSHFTVGDDNIMSQTKQISEEILELIDESLTYSLHLLMEKCGMTASEAKNLIHKRLSLEI